MPILAQAKTPPPPPPAPEPVVLTAEMVKAVMVEQQAHCAPTTWTKLLASLAARKFPFPTK